MSNWVSDLEFVFYFVTLCDEKGLMAFSVQFCLLLNFIKEVFSMDQYFSLHHIEQLSLFL